MRHPDVMHKFTLIVCLATSALVVIVGTILGMRFLLTHDQTSIPTTNVTTNAAIGGFPMSGNMAPDFSLTDQFGHAFTLSSLRGREVVLAFIDSRCKSLCPLTANIMYDAKARLSSTAANQVALIAVNANPTATSLEAVQAWSIEHGMLHQWLFLTGTPNELQAIYHEYGVYVQVDSSGNDVHDAATFIIDGNGHERLFFETLDSNSTPDLNSEVAGLTAGMQQWLPKRQ